MSFLDPDPDGEGRVPPPFFGRTVPLFTVGRKGSVAIIGLAGRKKTNSRAGSEKHITDITPCCQKRFHFFMYNIIYDLKSMTLYINVVWHPRRDGCSAKNPHHALG